ncbi:MAG: ethanolamine ammonia-lyase subunit EutB [Elusimicrobia bacterium]|nr:ethanolamine ammonia-lyase subunit EutB [Elusimicrobiota bacterium]
MDAARLRLLFARANEFKEGDLQLGGTADEAVRREAKDQVAALSLGELSRLALVEDAVTEELWRSLDRGLLAELSNLSVAQAKAALLGPGGAAWARRYAPALPSEAAAALVKVMSDDELSVVARSVHNPLPGRGTAVGAAGHLGSRIQPNSPGDDEGEILMSVLEGLAFGCGDVIIGLNPASDDLDTIVRTEKLLQGVVERLGLPTRYCVLSDLKKQAAARGRAKVDVGFQSLGGTSQSLAGMLGLDVDGLLELAQGFPGLYFETGQGSEVTNGAAQGVDMTTLESRCYGLARAVRLRCGGRWTILNDVAGFIGPEVFRTGPQLLRACLEDSVMAKLQGLTMGLDVCSTFHMGISPRELQDLTEAAALKAAPAYLMAVAGNADPMLGYLTTSFREHPRLRRAAGKGLASAMRDRLAALGVSGADDEPSGSPVATAALYARYMKAGGDSRTPHELAGEGLRRLAALQGRGFDLGYGAGPDEGGPPAAAARLEALFRNAREALYARLEPAVIKDSCARPARAATCSADRDDYLAHPASGERIAPEHCAELRRLYPGRRQAPQVQFVVSDGLNANAVNENLRAVLPGLRWALRQAGLDVGEADVVLDNGRVRAGYHAAQLIGPDLLVHLIGERPGTGLNQLSAYLTYGKGPAGEPRWSPDLAHSLTSAVCGMHPRGKAPEAAVAEMAALVRRMAGLRRSGTALTGPSAELV